MGSRLSAPVAGGPLAALEFARSWRHSNCKGISLDLGFLDARISRAVHQPDTDETPKRGGARGRAWDRKTLTCGLILVLEGMAPRLIGPERTRPSSHSRGKCTPPEDETPPATGPRPPTWIAAVRPIAPGHTPAPRTYSGSRKHRPTSGIASQPQHLTPQTLPKRPQRSSRTAYKA